MDFVVVVDVIEVDIIVDFRAVVVVILGRGGRRMRQARSKEL